MFSFYIIFDIIKLSLVSISESIDMKVQFILSKLAKRKSYANLKVLINCCISCSYCRLISLPLKA